MTVQEYLEQGKMLEHRIRYDLRKLKDLQALAYIVPPPVMEPTGVRAQRAGDAAFVRALARIGETQERVSREIDLLIALREQMDGVIRRLPREDYQLVLVYRYVENLTVAEVCDLLHIGRTTEKEWHRKALSMVSLPDDPIRISEIPGEPAAGSGD